MDADPELDVTLSHGRRVVTCQIAALDRDVGGWMAIEPCSRISMGWPATLHACRATTVSSGSLQVVAELNRAAIDDAGRGRAAARCVWAGRTITGDGHRPVPARVW